MKDLGEAAYILGIKIYHDRERGLIGISQSTYIEKVLTIFNMVDSKKGNTPMPPGIILSKKYCPTAIYDWNEMTDIPYALAIGFIMYTMTCTRPNGAYALSVTSRFQSDFGKVLWIKYILKYTSGELRTGS